MSQLGKSSNQIWKLLLGMLILCAIAVRFVLLDIWLIHWLDDDQALMWNATAAYAHFMIPEPYFWGQTYGVMMESFLAVPLYWLKVPLNIALPAATVFLAMAAYLFVSLLLMKDCHPKTACAVMASFLLMSWQWDVLTSVPRCFISGLSAAVIGAVCLNTGKTGRSAMGYSFLCVLSVIMTNSAAVIVGMGYLYFILRIKEEYRRLPALVGGTACGLLLYILFKNFYVINAEHNLHPAIGLELSIETLTANIERLPYVMADFIFIHKGWVVIFLLFLFLLYLVISKRWRVLLLLLSNIVLMFFLLSMKKTAEFSDDSVTFSQTRMFLCWTYSLLPIVFFWVEETDGVSGFFLDIEAFFEKKSSAAIICAAIMLIVLSANVLKLKRIDADVQSQDSRFRYGYMAHVYRSDDIIDTCKRIDKMAELTNADTVATGDRRALSYAFDAMYYGKYIVYNCVYDRRTWNYIALLQNEDRKCLFINGFGNEPIDYETIAFSDKGETPVQYFKKNYNYDRSPY